MAALPFNFDILPEPLAADLQNAYRRILMIPSPVPSKNSYTADSEVKISRDGEPLPEAAPRVLVAIGYPRSGKDYLGDYLMSRYCGVAKFAYSTPILDEVNSFLRPTGHVVNQQTKSFPHLRHLTQAWGAARRAEDPRYWVRLIERRADEAFAEGAQMVVLSGARVASDLDLQRYRNREVWRVQRPGNTYKADHAVESEAENLPVDRVVINSSEGDLEPFQKEIEKALYAKS